MRLPILALAALSWAAITLPQPAAAAPAVGAQPADGSPFFTVTAEPGQKLELPLSVAVESPATVEIAVAEAQTRRTNGGLSYPTDDPGGAAAWIDAPTSIEVTDRATVRATLTVPPETRPGHHVAGLVVSPSKAADRSVISLQSRTVIAVQVQVEPGGEAIPELTISGVEAVTTPRGEIELHAKVENTGRWLLHGDAAATINGATAGDKRLGTIHPGHRTAATFAWPDAPTGDHDVIVEISYSVPGDAAQPQVARWAGTVTVTPALQAEAETAPFAADDTPESDASERGTFWLWIALAALASGLLLGRATGRKTPELERAA